MSEASYPRLSRDHGDIPIHNFYFDGPQSDLWTAMLASVLSGTDSLSAKIPCGALPKALSTGRRVSSAACRSRRNGGEIPCRF